MAQINQRQMLPMGTVLDRRYRIVRYLASGGFGNTYVAEHILLGGQVAIKEFFMRGTNHRSADGTTVEVSNEENTAVFDAQLIKFRREARRIFELHSDHIIHVSDLFDANGTSYYVMDLITGTSLAEQTRQQPLSEQETYDAVLQVLDALETMHAAGLYHLDVKPGNIMRDSRGHCTLIDFGASKQLTADERATLSSSAMAYTPGYAPLEQVAQQSENIGSWTDFYALGATLYRLLTGTPPPVVAVTDYKPNGRQFPYPVPVSDTMRHAISTLMNPIYDLRPQTAAEVKVLLEGQTQSEKKVQPKENAQSEEKVQPKENAQSEKKVQPKENAQSEEKVQPKENTLSEEKAQPKGKVQSEETVKSNPTPALINEQTNYTSSSKPSSQPVSSPPSSSQNIPHHPSSSQNIPPSSGSSQFIPNDSESGDSDFDETPSRKRLWYILAGVALLVLIIGALLLRKSGGGDGLVTCPDDNHPHMIDLGLPSGTKWACCNVDANSPEEYGGYYAWGETTTKSEYNWKTYKHCYGDDTSCRNLGSSICGTRYDVAHVRWGGSWQMPTLNQIEELLNNCTSEWTTFNGVSGCKFISKSNGGSIFLPAAGHRWGLGFDYVGSRGYYWSGTQSTEREGSSSDLSFYSGACWVSDNGRYGGRSVRPVSR